MKKWVSILLSCGLFSLCSCKQNEAWPVEIPEKATTVFPLLPVIEPKLWAELKAAEATTADRAASEQQRAAASTEAKRITDLLEKKHPFHQDGNRTTLGRIVFLKDSGKIEIPAVVHYPKVGDDRHSDDLELILCSETGSAHETLFTTDVRPLHLELLMHLAGYKKSQPASTFKIEVVIPDHDPIPIETLISAIGNKALPERMLWEFSGSDSNDPYLPDASGASSSAGTPTIPF